MGNNVFTDSDSIKRLKAKNKPVVYHYAGKGKVSSRLSVRVSPKGKKVFLIHYYADGKSKRFTLGTFPALSLSEAKNLADEHAGNDPVAEKAQEKLDAVAAAERKRAEEIKQLSLRTMDDLWDKYSTLTKTTQKAASTQREEARKWRVDIQPVLGNIPVKDVTPEMIDNFLEKLARRSPVAANRVYSLLQIIFKPALKGGWGILSHPMQWLEKPASETPRKRVLSDDEIRAIWPYLGTTKSNAGDILKIILLTCQRPGEVSAMRWDDLDMDNRLWTQTNNKTDTTMLVPISDPVFEILDARKRTSEWIFPSRGKHTKDTSRARDRISKASGIEGWTAHDLRRTGRTLMSRLEIDQHIRERVLNHVQSGVVGVYDQHDYLREKTTALKKLGNEIFKNLGKDVEPGKVIKLRVQA